MNQFLWTPTLPQIARIFLPLISIWNYSARKNPQPQALGPLSPSEKDHIWSMHLSKYTCCQFALAHSWILSGRQGATLGNPPWWGKSWDPTFPSPATHPTSIINQSDINIYLHNHLKFSVTKNETYKPAPSSNISINGESHNYSPRCPVQKSGHFPRCFCSGKQWLKPPTWPSTKWQFAWVILLQEILVKNTELTSHHQPEEFRKGLQERGDASSYVLPESILDCPSPKSILTEHRMYHWARDNPETNPITIRPEAASHMAEPFSQVPLPCSLPRHPFPMKSLSACVSPQTIHFQVSLLGPGRGLPSCYTSFHLLNLLVSTKYFLYIYSIYPCSCPPCPA